jgi:hypothetical protein
MVTSLMQTTKGSSDGSSQRTPPHNVAVDRRLRDLSVHSPPQTCETSLGGHLAVYGSETNYVGATHWATILENVGTPRGRTKFSISRSRALDSRNSRRPQS